MLFFKEEWIMADEKLQDVQEEVQETPVAEDVQEEPNGYAKLAQYAATGVTTLLAGTIGTKVTGSKLKGLGIGAVAGASVFGVSGNGDMMKQIGKFLHDVGESMGEDNGFGQILVNIGDKLYGDDIPETSATLEEDVSPKTTSADTMSVDAVTQATPASFEYQLYTSTGDASRLTGITDSYLFEQGRFDEMNGLDAIDSYVSTCRHEGDLDEKRSSALMYDNVADIGYANYYEGIRQKVESLGGYDNLSYEQQNYLDDLGQDKDFSYNYYVDHCENAEMSSYIGMSTMDFGSILNGEEGSVETAKTEILENAALPEYSVGEDLDMENKAPMAGMEDYKVQLAKQMLSEHGLEDIFENTPSIQNGEEGLGL